MSESRPTLASEDNPHIPENEKHRFKAFFKTFSFGDASLEGDDDTGIINKGGDDKRKLQHDKDEQNQHRHRRHHSPIPLAFGHRKEAGLHGGAGVRWYHNLFPLNQKFEPRVEYPLWDDDW
jgi:hypothetical protein